MCERESVCVRERVCVCVWTSDLFLFSEPRKRLCVRQVSPVALVYLVGLFVSCFVCSFVGGMGHESHYLAL